MELIELIEEGISKNASDIHITVGVPPVFRINGKLHEYGKESLKPGDTKKLIEVKERYIPNMRNKAIYDKYFAVFKSLYKNNKEAFSMINNESTF